MACPKNVALGRLKVRSGDGTPLEKTVEFSEGDFTITSTRTLSEIEDRGILQVHQETQSQRVSGSFSAKLVDETLFRTLDQHVWDAQAETITGLTGGALNSNVATAYPFEQGSLGPAAGEASLSSKLAIAATPTVAGEYSEELGASDARDVIKVETADGFNVFQPAADTDVDVVYDAVGETTFADPDCSTVKYLQLIWEQLAADKTTVEKSYVLDFAAVSDYSVSEGEDANTVSFNFVALDKRFRVVDGAVP